MGTHPSGPSKLPGVFLRWLSMSRRRPVPRQLHGAHERAEAPPHNKLFRFWVSNVDLQRERGSVSTFWRIQLSSSG